MNFLRAGFRTALVAGVAIVSGLSCSGSIGGQSSNHLNKPELKEFPLWKFDEIGCRAKGRLQDSDYCKSTVMDQILAQGKDAIPILISQITDTRSAKEPIYDYWGPMTVGDVADLVLLSLFLDSDWKTLTMPGLEQIDLECGAASDQCYQQLLEKRGRKFIQNQWIAAWNTKKDHVYWSAEARCFRLTGDLRRK